MNPPRFADRLLRFFCAPHRLEEVQGDLHEEFAYQVQRIGKRRARWRYWWDVLGFLKLFAMKRRPSQYSTTYLMNPTMLQNYVKIAFRNLLKYKTFSFINVTGFALGLACCLLIGLYVYSELSFDRFHAKYDRIYRVNKVVTEAGKERVIHGITSGALAPAMTKEIPDIEYAVRIRPWFTDVLVSYDSIHHKLEDVVYADADFFNVFDFPLLKGNRNQVLSEPYTAVITERIARLYFGEADPIGKTLVTLNDIPVKITGVAKDVPESSHIRFNVLISWTTTTATANAAYFSWMNNWLTQVVYTYVSTREPAHTELLNAKIVRLLTANLPERQKEYQPYLQPLKTIHLQSDDVLFAESFRTNSGKIIYTLAIVAGIILLIACFNFINLSTASSLRRAKEVGVQKILGAQAKQLTVKFFLESTVVCFISLGIALLICVLILPRFNQLVQSHINAATLLKPEVTLALLGGLLVVSIVAGLYPAYFLTRFNPAKVFRSATLTGKSNGLRQALVTTQFALMTLLIVATLVISSQIEFLTQKDLGFNEDQVLVIQIANTGVEKKAREFMSTVADFGGVSNVSSTNRVPGQMFNGYGIVPEGFTENDHLMANVLEADVNFVTTYGISLMQGRFFAKEFPTDTLQSVVINEAMVRYLNWQNPIGKRLEVSGARKARVIGVVKDFNIASLRENVPPLAIILKSNPLYLTVKIRAGAIPETVAFLQTTWKKFDAAYPFDYYFLDEKLNQFYQSDKRMLTVISIFTGLTILIACLGLFGLILYITEQRTKEIGVRKVLGASVTSIVTLLSTDFLKLVVIAVVIASPVAWYAMNRWLQNFAYKIEMEWWMFALAGVLATGIALLTISFQSVKAALANPVKSLRSE